MRKVPGLRTPQPVGGIRMPASGFHAPSIPQAIPGVGATKTVLNAPKAAATGAAKAGALRTAGKALGPLGAVETVLSIPGSGPLAGTDAEYNPGPLLKMTGEFPYIHMRGSEQNPERAGMSNLGADYKQQEQQLANEALIFTGQQNRKKQLAAGGVPGQLPSDYKETEAAAFRAAAEAGNPQTPQIRQITAATGTDTGSGNREVTRVAQTDDMDANMRAWAAANPELAANLVKKVDARRMNNPEYTQVGYDQARQQADPSYDPNARSQNFGPVADAGEYGRNLRLMGTEGRGPVADGGLYADMISGKEKPNAQTFKDKAMKKIIDAPAEALPPSTTQNPTPAGGDGTPIDSEPELRKATTPLKDRFTLTPDEVGAAINAGNLDQQLSRLGRRM